jgi:hypothetical protein
MNGVLPNWKKRWHRATCNRATARDLEAIGRPERMHLADNIGLAARIDAAFIACIAGRPI